MLSSPPPRHFFWIQNGVGVYLAPHYFFIIKKKHVFLGGGGEFIWTYTEFWLKKVGGLNWKAAVVAKPKSRLALKIQKILITDWIQKIVTFF